MPFIISTRNEDLSGHFSNDVKVVIKNGMCPYFKNTVFAYQEIQCLPNFFLGRFERMILERSNLLILGKSKKKGRKEVGSV